MRSFLKIYLINLFFKSFILLVTVTALCVDVLFTWNNVTAELLKVSKRSQNEADLFHLLKFSNKKQNWKGRTPGASLQLE